MGSKYDCQGRCGVPCYKKKTKKHFYVQKYMAEISLEKFIERLKIPLGHGGSQTSMS